MNVSAVDRFKSFTLAGGAGVGFVGVAGGVDIGVADSSVAAYIAGGTVRAAANVEVYSLSRKQVATYALSLGAGAVGVAVSVSVWTIGTQPVTTYHSADGGRDRETFSAATAAHADNFYRKGDVVTHLGKRYAAKVDHASNNGGDDDAPNDNPADWQAESEALAGNNSVSGADGVASGNGNGYKSVFGGTTSAPPADTWSAATPYASGDTVYYGGVKYVAVTANTNKQPDTNPAFWSASNGESSTNSRISSALFSGPGNPNAAISAASPGNSAASAAFGPTAGGTTAYIDATVIAGGHVRVWAIDDLEVTGLAGALAGGVVGVGASILVLTVKSNTDAKLGSSAIVSADGQVSVKATMDEDTTAWAIAGVGGLVAVGGQVAVVNDTSTQKAHIEDDATINKAAGGLVVNAVSDRDVNTYAIGVQIGAVSVGAGVAVVNVSGDATASIGNVAVAVTGPVSSISVTATDTVRNDILAVAVGVGAAAFSGALAFANLDGKVSAKSGAHGTVGSGGVTVKADGTHTAQAQTVNVNVGGIAIGLTVGRADNGRSTEAWVTETGSVSTTGAVLVEATATNTADTTQVFPQVDAGGATMSILVRFAYVSGFTRATVDGDFSNASSITVTSSAQNTAKTNVALIGLSVVGLTGVFAWAEVTSGAAIETVVNSSASLSGTGAILVEAKTKGTGNRATVSSGGVQFGGVAASALIISGTVANPVSVTLDGDLDNHLERVDPRLACSRRPGQLDQLRRGAHLHRRRVGLHRQRQRRLGRDRVDRDHRDHGRDELERHGVQRPRRDHGELEQSRRRRDERRRRRRALRGRRHRSDGDARRCDERFYGRRHHRRLGRRARRRAEQQPGRRRRRADHHRRARHRGRECRPHRDHERGGHRRGHRLQLDDDGARRIRRGQGHLDQQRHRLDDRVRRRASARASTSRSPRRSSPGARRPSSTARSRPARPRRRACSSSRAGGTRRSPDLDVVTVSLGLSGTGVVADAEVTDAADTQALVGSTASIDVSAPYVDASTLRSTDRPGQRTSRTTR